MASKSRGVKKKSSISPKDETSIPEETICLKPLPSENFFTQIIEIIAPIITTVTASGLLEEDPDLSPAEAGSLAGYILSNIDIIKLDKMMTDALNEEKW